MLNKKALAATAGAQKVYVEDVFGTYLYTGNGSTQTITNNIDLSGEGGLTWIKTRSTIAGNRLFDTARGATKELISDSGAGESTVATSLTAFNNNGFSLGADIDVNTNGNLYASWTFRKAKKFFDIVTYSGNGTAGRQISHNLGSTPGCVIVKNRTSAGNSWIVWHRGLSSGYRVSLDSVANQTNTGAKDYFGNGTIAVDPTSTVFTVGALEAVNKSGETYVAYVFAHDAGGFGDSGSDNVISCGSYTGNGSATGPTITLGWEPQFVIIKRIDDNGGWLIHDSIRGIPLGSYFSLRADTTAAEVTGSGSVQPTATGFTITLTDILYNASGGTYIYIAVRRGQMKAPTVGTEVFQPVVYTGTNVDNRLVNTGIATDMVLVRQRNDTTVSGMVVGDRIRGNNYLLTGATAANNADVDSFMTPTLSYGNSFSAMDGFGVGNDATSKLNQSTVSNNQIVETFKRASNFFDIVSYTGTGSNTTISHNLGVAPEWMIVKRTNSTGNWVTYYGLNTNYININSTAGGATASDVWNNTSPTSSVFSLGTNTSVNTSGGIYIAYLFASCPGVSKVGSYTGNGTSQTINCGFTSGARFVLIKRTDSTGDWYVYDSARGIVTGNDPQLKLNSTAAEATGFDAIDPDNSGFIVNNDATNFPINVNSATYFYLAIA